MKYVVSGLQPGLFSQLSSLSDDAVHSASARRVIADAKPGFLCRVSLEDAEAGEGLILLPLAHHVDDSPYSASGPIFIRELALESTHVFDELPEQLRIRLLSIRFYDVQGDMVVADVVEGGRLPRS